MVQFKKIVAQLSIMLAFAIQEGIATEEKEIKKDFFPKATKAEKEKFKELYRIKINLEKKYSKLSAIEKFRKSGQELKYKKVKAHNTFANFWKKILKKYGLGKKDSKEKG